MSKIVEIINFLEAENLLNNCSKYWWPSYGRFEVLIGAILTQNTTWQNVQKSIKNLQDYLEFDRFLLLDVELLKEKIRPSGFYNQKAPRLLQLTKNVKKDFITFENFKDKVSRKWLLSQKGVGEETADSILCYCCGKDQLVIDTYTKRVLKQFDIEFKNYIDYKSYLENNIKNNWDVLSIKYENNLNLCYAQFHGMIVEYNKVNKKKEKKCLI